MAPTANAPRYTRSRSLTACNVGSYRPSDNSKKDPETPGSTRAQTATAAASATTIGLGSSTTAGGSPVMTNTMIGRNKCEREVLHAPATPPAHHVCRDPDSCEHESEEQCPHLDRVLLQERFDETRTQNDRCHHADPHGDQQLPWQTAQRARAGRAGRSSLGEAEELSEGEHRIRDRIDDRSVDADDESDRSATDPGDDFGYADKGTANEVRNNRNHRLTVEAGRVLHVQRTANLSSASTSVGGWTTAAGFAFPCSCNSSPSSCFSGPGCSRVRPRVRCARVDLGGSRYVVSGSGVPYLRPSSGTPDCQRPASIFQPSGTPTSR